MRKVLRNSIITVKGIKRHQKLILAESGRNYQIKSDAYTDAIPYLQSYYWVLKKKSNIYIVLKAIKSK